MIRNLFFSFFLILCSGILSAQVLKDPSFAVKDDDGSLIADWSIQLEKPGAIKIGDEVNVCFDINIVKANWHAYSASKAPNTANKPTDFLPDLSLCKDLKLVSVLKDTQKPHEYEDEIMGGFMREFNEHKVRWIQKVIITGPNPVLVGETDYQVCLTDGKCIPAGFQVKFSLGNATGNSTESVIDSPDKVDSPSTDTNVAIVSGTEPAIVASEKKGGCGDKNLWLLFLEAFVFGFAAVLTPCVFPMIPLTVTFFTKQSATRSIGIRNALIYSFFIVFIYTILGVTVSVAFGDDFLYLMSINPWVNLGFFALLFVFALSFLGMFEITLPSSWSTKLDQKSEKGGLIGVFFMALTLAVVSFSCTGPLVGTALIEAAGGCLIGPIIAMLGFSLALAIPFGAFALFPGMMNSLPRSGGWLNSVKVVLGFLEIALGLKFLSQADLVMKWHILDREVFIAGWIVIFALIGLYLLGKISLPHDDKVEKLSVPRVMFSLAAFWFVLYLIPGLWGANLPFLSGLLPPPNSEVGVKMIGATTNNEGTLNQKICEKKDRKYYSLFKEKEGHGFCTFYDLDEALAFAKEIDAPLFVDFTGHTCANCRQMEHKVWPQEVVKNLFLENFVMVSLYVDESAMLDRPEMVGEKTVKTIGKKWLEYEKQYYSKVSQPYYAIIDHDKSNLVAPRGYTPNVDEYAKWLEEGLKAYKTKRGKE